MAKQRIQKVLAEAGIASRRYVEEMILNGRITVNGKLVLQLPCFVEPADDDIRVDNKPVPRHSEIKTYILLNKPRGVVCTQRDPRGRAVATDLLPDTVKQRVYCAGGLDDETTGLVVLTNDGELTKYMTSYGHVQSKYLAEVEGKLSEDDVNQIKRGMFFDGRRTPPARLRMLRATPTWSVLEIELPEGRKTHLRRMFARLGHKVTRLKRTGLGPLTERGLKIGHSRPLKPEEVARLMGKND